MTVLELRWLLLEFCIVEVSTKLRGLGKDAEGLVCRAHLTPLNLRLVLLLLCGSPIHSGTVDVLHHFAAVTKYQSLSS